MDMRYEIQVDHIARICVWRSRQHFAVMHASLEIAPALRHRIDAWIERHTEIRNRQSDDEDVYAAWLTYDEEGRQIARQLKPALGRDAEVFYYCEATEDFEPVV